MSAEMFMSGAAFVDNSDRTKLHFKGEQAFWFVDQLLTNESQDLAQGEGQESLLLTPKGRITAAFKVLSSGSSVFSDTEPGLGPELLEFFTSRIFTTKVEITDRTKEFALFSVFGPDTDEVAGRALEKVAKSEGEEQRAIGMGLPGERELGMAHYGSSVAVRLARPSRGLDVWVKAELAEAVRTALTEVGARAAMADDFAALCVVGGLARHGVDFDNGYLPQEAALERAVHFSKGCYLGQEAVAMAQRGKVNRRIFHLFFAGPPLPGEVSFEDQPVGSVSSVAESAAPNNGRGFGIATLKTIVTAGSKVIVSLEGRNVEAVVAELPGTTRGPQVPSARELREKLGK